MQRLGGGAYTRKNRKGGGNDPRCGCDMQAGWPRSLVDNIPRPMSGGSCGGSCGVFQPTTGGGGCGAAACAGPLVPNQPATQYGTGCGCAGSSGYTSLVPGIRGGKRKGSKRTRGGKRGLLFANGGGCGCTAKLFSGGGCGCLARAARGGGFNENPAPVDFKNFGVTLSDTRANVSSIANYNGKGGGSNENPAPVDFKGFGVTLSDTKANVSSIANYNGKGGGCPVPDACPFPGTGACDFYAKGGGAASVGDNGGFTRCGCLANPRLLHGGSALINRMQDVIIKIEQFLRKYPALQAGDIIPTEQFIEMSAESERLYELFDEVDDELDGSLSNSENEKKIEMYDADHKLRQRVQQYATAVRQGGNVATLRGGFIRAEDLIIEMNKFLEKYPPLRDGDIVTREQFAQMESEDTRIGRMFDTVFRSFTNNEMARSGPMQRASLQMEARVAQYGRARERAGGYTPSKRNLKYLKRYRQGKSIGFTMRSSLKAKGLIPRTSRKNRGKKVVSKKYQ